MFNSNRIQFDPRKEIMIRSQISSLAFVLFTLLLAIGYTPPTLGATNEVEALRQELKQLESNYYAMRKDIEEIKALIRFKQAASQKSGGIVLNVEKLPFKGDKNARVTIIEISEYECPFCGRFVDEVLPQLTKEYIDTGKVKYFFQDFPLDMHAHAMNASEAALCAGEQGKYWQMHDQLFAHRDALESTNLTAYAAAIGLVTLR